MKKKKILYISIFLSKIFNFSNLYKFNTYFLQKKSKNFDVLYIYKEETS